MATASRRCCRPEEDGLLSPLARIEARADGTLDPERFPRTDHLIDAIGSRAVRGGLVAAASHGLKFAIVIVATSILARLLTPQDYGIIGMVAVAANLVSMFKDLGLAHATVQRPAINAAQISTLFWVNVAISLGCAVLMAVCAPGISWFYGEPRLTMVTVVTARLLTGWPCGSARGAAQAADEVRRAEHLRPSFHDHGVSRGHLLRVARDAVLGPGMRQLGCLPPTRWASGWSVGGDRTACARVRRGSMLEFGGNITAYATVGHIARNADALAHRPASSARNPWGSMPRPGSFSPCLRIKSMSALTAVAIPVLSRVADAPERYRKVYLRIVEKVVMVTMPAVALMMVTADWLVGWVLGAQWTETSLVLVCLGPASMVQPVTSFGGMALRLSGSRQGHVAMVDDQRAPSRLVHSCRSSVGSHWRGDVVFSRQGVDCQSSAVLVCGPPGPHSGVGLLPPTGALSRSLVVGHRSLLPSAKPDHLR